MSINRNDSLNILAPKAVDRRYDNDGTHFTSVAAANAGILSEYRYVGLTVGIMLSGVLTEHWYRDGIANGDLVVKETSGALENIFDNDGATPGSVIIGGGKTTTGILNISLDVADTNATILLSPKGTGTLRTTAGHTSNISNDNDLVTKKYYDDNLPAGVTAAGSSGEIQFNTADALDSASTLTYGSNILTVDDVQLGSGLGAFAGLKMGVVENRIYSDLTTSKLVISTGGSEGSDGASISLFGDTHASTPGQLDIASIGAGVLTLKTGGSTRLSVSDAGAFNFQGNALSGVLSISSAGNLTLSPNSTSEYLLLGNLPTVSLVSADQLLVRDVSVSNRIGVATITAAKALFNEMAPTYVAARNQADGANNVKDIEVGTSASATRYYFVQASAEVITDDSNSVTLEIKTHTSAITNISTGTAQLTSVVKGEGGSTRVMKNISGWITLAASDSHIAIVATGTGSQVGDVRIFAMSLTNNTDDSA